MIFNMATHEISQIQSAYDHFQSIGKNITSILPDHPLAKSYLLKALNHFHLTTPADPDHLVVPPDIKNSALPYLQNNHSQLIHTTLAFTHNAFHFIELSLFAIIAFATFTYHGAKLDHQMQAFSTRLIGPQGPTHLHQITRALRGTVTGIVLVGLIQSLAIMPALILFHTPHPGIATLAILIASLIPFCAPVALLFISLATLIYTGTTGAIIITAWGMTVIFSGDHFIKPKLVGSSTSLGFLASMIAILGGLKTLGFLGLFLSPAIFSLATALWIEFSATGTTKDNDHEQQA